MPDESITAGDDSNLAAEFRDCRLINWLTRRPRISSDRGGIPARAITPADKLEIRGRSRASSRANEQASERTSPTSGTDSVRCGRKVPTAIEKAPWALSGRQISMPVVFPHGRLFFRPRSLHLFSAVNYSHSAGRGKKKLSISLSDRNGLIEAPGRIFSRVSFLKRRKICGIFIEAHGREEERRG